MSERGTSTRKGPRKTKGHRVEWRADEQRDGELGATVKKRIGRRKDGDMENHGKDGRRGEIKREEDFKHPEGVLRKGRNCPG